MLIWIDDRIGIEIIATSVGNTNLSHCLVKSWEEAEDLARRLTSLCPACGVPGFSRVGLVRGLPCEDCGTPTNEAKADIHRCVRCEHQMRVEREWEYASARFCGYCNP
ncbi:MAG: DUF6671 family protein [Methylococcaceae bacterium]